MPKYISNYIIVVNFVLPLVKSIHGNSARKSRYYGISQKAIGKQIAPLIEKTQMFRGVHVAMVRCDFYRREIEKSQ